MSPRIALITDSTCDIPAEWIKQYDIAIVPLTIIFGDQQYLDGVEMTPAQFYERLPNASRPPTTSQPAPEAFLNAYRRAAENGASEIIAMTISKAMSGTVESARQAAQDFPIPVHVIDGKNTSMGIGWQVIAAARVREAGGGVEAMLAAAEQVRRDMAFYVTLDTIEYLSRGGRIMEAARFLDSILRIKPLVFIRPESGAVGASIPSRSRKAALEDLYREFFRRINAAGPLHIAVMHTGAQQEAEALAERLRQEHPGVETFTSIAAPVLGVHAGPRAIALIGYAEK